MKSKLLSVSCIVLMLFSGITCNKSELTRNGHAFNITISGKVLDQNASPLAGVQVEAGGKNTTTDINGSFEIRNVIAQKDGTLVKLSKAGYFTGYRTFTPTANTTNNIEVTLILKNTTGGFSSTFDVTFGATNGGTISFPANAFVNQATNAAYNGYVTLSTYFINPVASNFRSIMPGDLRGINNAGAQVGLQSFGMMAVELEGNAGEKLQLAAGKQATISFPIPTAFATQAPTTIPLWFFDETTGQWKEEGTATKQGSNYVGSVSHFSFWNVDAPFPVINFTAIIQDQKNNPVTNASIEIRRTNGSSGYGNTDANGRVSGMIPSNELLKLIVVTRCGRDSVNIGPFSSNVDLGVIHVNVNNPTVTATISGTVVNCTGGAVTNGYVNILTGGINSRTNITNGSFSHTLFKCNSNPTTVQLVATDISGAKQSAPVNLTVTSGNVNAGQISACISLNSYISFNINGTNTLMAPPSDSLEANVQYILQTSIFGFNIDSTANHSFSLGFLANTPSTVPIDLLSISVGQNDYYRPNGTTINVNLTEFGSSGQYIAGNFAGNIRDSIRHSFVPITCNFRVRRY